jgi:S-(hydroxymethyl)glutathione dehydrogenase/alcohol dehydrogenase
VIQAAALVSAYPIIATDLFDNRLELAKTLGATHVLNATREDPEARIREIVGKDGVDVAIDNTGNVKVIESAYRVTKGTGRTVLVGVPHRNSTASFYTLPLHFDKTLTGSHGGEAQPAQDIPRYVRLCQSGKLDLRPVLSKRYRLEEINTTIAEMQSGALTGRAIIRIGM